MNNPYPALEDAVGEAIYHADITAKSALAVQMSIAISLKRIADAMQGFTDHPDNANAYGETGMQAIIGELHRFKQDAINEISVMLNRIGR